MAQSGPGDGRQGGGASAQETRGEQAARSPRFRTRLRLGPQATICSRGHIPQQGRPHRRKTRRRTEGWRVSGDRPRGSGPPPLPESWTLSQDPGAHGLSAKPTQHRASERWRSKASLRGAVSHFSVLCLPCPGLCLSLPGCHTPVPGTWTTAEPWCCVAAHPVMRKAGEQHPEPPASPASAWTTLRPPLWAPCLAWALLLPAVLQPGSPHRPALSQRDRWAWALGIPNAPQGSHPGGLRVAVSGWDLGAISLRLKGNWACCGLQLGLRAPGWFVAEPPRRQARLPLMLKTWSRPGSLHSFPHSLTHSSTHSLTHPLTHSSLTHSLIHSVTHSFTHPFTDSRIHSLIHSLMHTFIHSFTHSLTHSLIHSLPLLLVALAEAPPPRARPPAGAGSHTQESLDDRGTCVGTRSWLIRQRTCSRGGRYAAG